MKSWGWKSFTIIYETNEGLVRLQELLKAYGSSDFPITVRQLTDTGDYRYADSIEIVNEMKLNINTWISVVPSPLLKQIKNSAEAHIILDCSIEKIYEVLKQAQQIGMMSDYHSYLITSLVSQFFFFFSLERIFRFFFISATGFANNKFRWISLWWDQYNCLSFSRSLLTNGTKHCSRMDQTNGWRFWQYGK